MPKKKSQIDKVDTIDKLIDSNNGVLTRGSSEDLAFGRIPFNIPSLDTLIGGGIPKKKITILSGQSNSGKSYLASQAVVSVQKNGGLVSWIDNELSWDKEWMNECGVDLDNIAISQPSTGEETFDIIKTCMQSGVDLIVLDSISGIVPSVMVNDENFGYNPIAWQARFINQSLPRILPYLKYGSALILINQVRQALGNVTYIDSLPGGKAQSFFAHLILQVRRSGWISVKDNNSNEKVGFDIEITNRKTKAGGYSQGKCVIPFKFDGGLDMVELYIREGLQHGIIDQSGVWYQLFCDGNKRILGMNAVKQYLIDNPDNYDKLVQMVNNKGNPIFPTVEENYDDGEGRTENDGDGC